LALAPPPCSHHGEQHQPDRGDHHCGDDANRTDGDAFGVGTGVGAKRILASRERREPLDLDRAYVTARFVVGLLF
jgi:hypothetical protein